MVYEPEAEKPAYFSQDDLNGIMEDLIDTKKGRAQQIYEKARTASLVMEGLKTVTVFFEQLRSIPFVGGLAQLISILPKTLSILINPKKPLAEKVISAAVITSIVTLTVLAFFLGTIGALITGVVIGLMMVGLDLRFASKATQTKLQTTSAYDEKKAFVNLIKNRVIFSKDKKFIEQLEIRALELEYTHTLYPLDEEAQKERDFIRSVLPKNDTKHHLKSLYEKRSETLLALGKQLDALTYSAYSEATELDLGPLIALDKDIASITKPFEPLKFKNELANRRLFISYANMGIVTTGAAVSVVALLLGAGVFVAPPVFLPLMVVVAVSLSVLAVVRWAVEVNFEKKVRAQAFQNEIRTHKTLLKEAALMFSKPKEASVVAASKDIEEPQNKKTQAPVPHSHSFSTASKSAPTLFKSSKTEEGMPSERNANRP